jgi:NAD(P)-dependent dehydrogenase (short-subunit alcohol dehydrogenase family)
MAGRLDGVVNNAAIFARQPLFECNVQSFDDMWRVNARAPMLLTKMLAEHVAARESGARAPVAGVVNLLDQRIAHPVSGCLPYLVSKQALAAFTQSAAHELAPRLTVNGVAPGATLMPVAPEGREPAGAMPLGTRCTPEQIAAAVVFLLANPAITGQIVFVDGGQHLVSDR